MKILHLLFPIFLLGCGGGSAGTGLLNTTDIREAEEFSGIVVDSSNQPVSGATVTVLGSEQQVRTDSSGRFTAQSTPPDTTLVVNSDSGSTRVENLDLTNSEIRIQIDTDSKAKLCKSGKFECAENEFCQFPVGVCGAENSLGVCVQRPEICTMEYTGVCGCDGKTYSTRCTAAGAGASVNYDSECN